MPVITRIDRSMFAYTSQVRHAASTSLVEVAQLITLDDIGQFVLTIILVCCSIDRYAHTQTVEEDELTLVSIYLFLLLLLYCYSHSLSATGT